MDAVAGDQEMNEWWVVGEVEMVISEMVGWVMFEWKMVSSFLW